MSDGSNIFGSLDRGRAARLEPLAENDEDALPQRPPDYRFKTTPDEIVRPRREALERASDDLLRHQSHWSTWISREDGIMHFEGWWKPGHEREGAKALGALLRVIFPERFSSARVAAQPA